MDSEEEGDDKDDSADEEELPGELIRLYNAGFQLPDFPALTKRNHWWGTAGNRSGASGDLSLFGSQSIAMLMVGSTPAIEMESKKVLILVWIVVGVVLSFEEFTHYVVEIYFSDASKRSFGIKYYKAGVQLRMDLISWRPAYFTAHQGSWKSSHVHPFLRLGSQRILYLFHAGGPGSQLLSIGSTLRRLPHYA